jgi:hypothetical protein
MQIPELSKPTSKLSLFTCSVPHTRIQEHELRLLSLAFLLASLWPCLVQSILTSFVAVEVELRHDFILASLISRHCSILTHWSASREWKPSPGGRHFTRRWSSTVQQFLSHSQHLAVPDRDREVPAVGLYPEPHELSPHCPSYFSNIPFLLSFLCLVFLLTHRSPVSTALLASMRVTCIALSFSTLAYWQRAQDTCTKSPVFKLGISSLTRCLVCYNVASRAWHSAQKHKKITAIRCIQLTKDIHCRILGSRCGSYEESYFWDLTLQPYASFTQHNGQVRQGNRNSLLHYTHYLAVARVDFTLH